MWTDEQKKKIGEWLKSKGGGTACRACGAKPLGICGRAVVLPVEERSGGPGLGAEWRCVMIHCDGCGDVRLLKASVVGV